MRWLTLLMTLALALSGCTVPFLEDDANGASIARIVRLELGEDTWMSDAAPEPQVSYVYTQHTGTLAVASARVLYMDAEEQLIDKPMTDFTAKNTLEAGDSVTFPNALLTGDITIMSDGTTIASRQGTPQDWLMGGGYPLPLAISPGAAAEWDFRGEAALELGLDRIAMTEYGETVAIENAEASLGFEIAGTTSLQSSTEDGMQTVTLGLDATGGLTAYADAFVVTEGTEPSTVRYGAEASLDGRVDGSMKLKFSGGELRAAGAEGSVFADASLIVWDEEHTKEERWEFPFLPSPLLDETMPYEEEAVPDESPEAELVKHLQRIWSLDLAPGDRYTYIAELPVGEGETFEMRHETHVAASEPYTTSAGTFDALRIHSALGYNVPGAGFSLPPMEATLWVTERGYMPLAVEQTFTYTLRASDLSFARDWIDALELPADGQVTLRYDTAMELTSHRPDIEMAGILFAGQAGWMAALSPVMGDDMFMGSDWDDEWDEPAMAPQVSFKRDEAEDQLTVVKTDAGLWWSEFTFDGSPGVHVALNGEPMMPADGSAPLQGVMSAGDVLQFCGDGVASVQIVHSWTETLIYESSFDLAACA